MTALVSTVEGALLRKARLRTVLWFAAIVPAVPIIAGGASQLQSLLWFDGPQRPVAWLARQLQPIMPPSRALAGQGPFSPGELLYPRSWPWDAPYRSIADCELGDLVGTYWPIHVIGFAFFASLAIRRARRFGVDWSDLGLPRALTLSSLVATLLPAAGQLMWTFAQTMERIQIAAVTRLDPLTGEMVAYDPSVPATGPAARAGIIVGCLLAELWILMAFTIAVARRAILASVRAHGLCPRCGYALIHAGCPECGSTENDAVGAGHAQRLWWRLTAGAAITIFLLTPFVLGWIGAMLPEKLWYKWVPF